MSILVTTALAVVSWTLTPKALAWASIRMVAVCMPWNGLRPTFGSTSFLVARFRPTSQMAPPNLQAGGLRLLILKGIAALTQTLSTIRSSLTQRSVATGQVPCGLTPVLRQPASRVALSMLGTTQVLSKTCTGPSIQSKSILRLSAPAPAPRPVQPRLR